MNSFDIILFPTDFSEETNQAFQIACSVARDQFASLVVVHVLPPEHCPKGECNAKLTHEDAPIVLDCRERFRQMNALAGEIPISFRIVFGYAIGAILNVAHEENADLIVVASHHRSRYRLQLHGSVADGLLRQSHCPVMCVTQPRLTSSLASPTSYMSSVT